MTTHETGVMVAVGPQGIAEGTLSFAATEAERRGTALELVHVVHPVVKFPVSPERMETLERVLSSVGRKAIGEALDRLGQLGVRLPVSTRLASGPVAITLVELAQTKQLVVLERRELATFERFVTLSTSSRVAARARPPVAVVPRGWRPCAADVPVTAAVNRPEDAEGPLDLAADHARATGRPLRVLHAIWLAEPYHSTAILHDMRNQWIKEMGVELDPHLDRLAARGVQATCEIRWSPPAQALIDATGDSALLVLSRRPHERALSPHLGPLTRAVLSRTRCPVLVVDRDGGTAQTSQEA